jgi:hypothetical protein
MRFGFVPKGPARGLRPFRGDRELPQLDGMLAQVEDKLVVTGSRLTTTHSCASTALDPSLS